MITVATPDISTVQEAVLMALMDKGEATLTDVIEHTGYSRDWSRQALSELRSMGYALRIAKADAEGLQVGLWSLTAPGIVLALATAPD